jgi:hypothetical protein
MTNTVTTLFALLCLLLGACADVSASARARAVVAVELGSAGSAAGSAGESSTGGADAAGGASGAPVGLGGSAGLPSAGSAGESSTGGAGAAGAPTVVDPCASPVLLPGDPLPAGAFRQVGREWRAHDNPSRITAFPAPCAGSAIETDPVCRAWFPVLVEVCP